MRIVVSGSIGFIGSHLVPAFLSAGHDVIGIDRPGERGHGGVPMHLVDVTEGEGLSTATEGADAVVHLAARNHVLRETAGDPLSEYRRVNVDGSRNLARAAARSGVKIFLHMSSVKAMGEGSDRVLDENSPCAPRTDYGISKLESERAVREEAERTGMGVVILRLPMVYGPGNKGNLPRMIRWADRGLPFPLVQPDNLRSMVYVGNVSAAVVAVLETLRSGNPAQGTYIVTDDVDRSTRMIYSSICQELGKPPRFLPVPAALGRIAAAVSEDFRRVASSFRVSSAKIREEIGFSPPVSGDEGMARTVRWFRHSDR